MSQEQPRIIKPGVPKEPTPWLFPPLPQTTCHSCGCIFTYSEKDKYLSGTGNAEWYAVKCPQKGCGRSVSVSEMF